MSPEKRAAYYRVANENRRLNRARYHEYDIKRNYGLDWPALHFLLAANNNACKACGRQFAGRVKYAVDHDHDTGRVRGLLCCNCNSALGMLGDDPDRVAGLLRYISDQKAIG
jgi:hypothetical protein